MSFSTAFFASIMGLGAMELVLILGVLLLLFGGAKLPSLARGLGQSIKEFKKSARDDDPAEKTAAAAPAATVEAKKTEPAAPSRSTHGAN